ncbi:hypothetical protein BH10PSE19_BH10PSE19_00880 [soil metagenome]
MDQFNILLNTKFMDKYAMNTDNYFLDVGAPGENRLEILNEVCD